MQSKFKKLLIKELPQSTGSMRRSWAKKIVDEKYDLDFLSECLELDYKVASRFSSLLSDIGEYDSDYLRGSLTSLFSRIDKIEQIDFKTSFAKYWKLAGVPKENEGNALNLLMELLNSATTNVSVKSYSLGVLFDLFRIYPEIKNELIVSIENELENNTPTFKKKALNVLDKIQMKKYE